MAKDSSGVHLTICPAAAEPRVGGVMALVTHAPCSLVGIQCPNMCPVNRAAWRLSQGGKAVLGWEGKDVFYSL